MLKRISALGAVAAAACLVTGVAQASTSYSGSVANPGCANAHGVPVGGASRIDAALSSTSAENNNVYVDVVAPDGTVAASGASYVSYDTPGGGSYSLRVCTRGSQIDPPSLQYTVTYATGPAGQPALPRTQGAVLGANTTLSRDVHGTGAIRTARGLAYFTIKMRSNGAAIVRVYNPRTNMHTSFTNAGVHFLSNGVSFTQGRMTMRLTQSGSLTRIAYHSPRFKASGAVVKGSFLIV